MQHTSPYGLRFGEREKHTLLVGEVWRAEAPIVTLEFRKLWKDPVAQERLIKLGYTWKGGKTPVVFWQKAQSEEELEAIRTASRAEDAEIDIPRPPGLNYLPFQRGGIAFARDREGTLIGDEMGLGKTIQAIGLANFMQPRPERILVGCPASLKKNWYEEITRWQVLNLPIYLVMPDTKLVLPLPRGWWIVSWEIAQKFEPELKTNQIWDLAIIDEVHKLKNPLAVRTKFFFGGRERNEQGKLIEIPAIRAKKRIALTGTPICNRPLEIQPVIAWLQPKQFGDVAAFTKRFCGADGRGAKNLPLLQNVLRETVMVRRLKSQVLKDLPRKQRQVVVLDVNSGDYNSRRSIKEELDENARFEREVEDANYAKHKARAEGNEESYDAAVAKLKMAYGIHFTQMSRVRHATAVAKVPYVIEHLNDLDETKKYIIFAHHNDVCQSIYRAMLPHGAVMMTQQTPINERQEIAHKFQDDPKIHFIILTIGVGGVGFTLTASSHVIFAELDWVPGNVTQAEDRAHRIGQLSSVLVQHLVFDGSLDSKMAKTIVEKQAIIDAALDDEHAKPEDDQEEDSEAGAAKARKKKPWRKDEPIRLTKAQIDAIHAAVRIVAGQDGDRARQVNGAGFNKYDTKFGHELARQQWLSPRQADAGKDMIQKYRRQFPKELYAQIFGEVW